jgi:hypothetical protein
LTTGEFIAIQEVLDKCSVMVSLGEKSILHRIDPVNKLFSKESMEGIMATLVCAIKFFSDWTYANLLFLSTVCLSVLYTEFKKIK